MTNKESK